jgi:signal transduction histidine kinase
MGLQGMRERAELIGACLQIESQPGAGTQVHLRVERQLEGQP